MQLIVGEKVSEALTRLLRAEVIGVSCCKLPE